MSLGALIGWGAPPVGLGVFARDDLEPGPWRHAAINVFSANRRELAARAHERGQAVWCFGGPGRMAPSNWREAIARIRSSRDELGAIGAVCEYEDAWPWASDDERRAYGRALGELALEMRVCVTYFPEIGGLEVLADACGMGVVGMVQMHGLSSTSPATFARWWARSTRAWGLRLCLAIAGWESSTRLDSADEYRRYLPDLPKCSSAWVWPLGGSSIPRYMLEALSSYEPGGSLAGTVLEASLRWVARPVGVAVVVVALALLALLVVLWRSARAHV